VRRDRGYRRRWQHVLPRRRRRRGVDTFLTGEGSLYTELFAFECGLTLVRARIFGRALCSLCLVLADTQASVVEARTLVRNA
jgi:hypothetical protein